jgi:hypothetical protein
VEFRIASDDVDAFSTFVKSCLEKVSPRPATMWADTCRARAALQAPRPVRLARTRTPWYRR